MSVNPFIWNGLSIGSGGGGGGSSLGYGIIQTDTGTPTASIPNDIITFTSDLPTAYYFDGDAGTDTITFKAPKLWNKSGDNYSNYHTTSSREWFQVPQGFPDTWSVSPSDGALRFDTERYLLSCYSSNSGSFEIYLTESASDDFYLRRDGGNSMMAPYTNTNVVNNSVFDCYSDWTGGSTYATIRVGINDFSSSGTSSLIHLLVNSVTRFLTYKTGETQIYLESGGPLSLIRRDVVTQKIDIIPNDGTVSALIRGGGNSKPFAIASTSTQPIHFITNYSSGLTNSRANFDGTNGTLNLTPPTLTGSTAASALTFTQTWNTTGTPDLILATLTDTASNAASNLMRLRVNSVDRFTVTKTGKHVFDSTITATGTTGNQTINKPSGTVNFAAAATSLTVTNSLVTTSSIIFCVVRTNDATALIKNVVPAAGSFTINLNAAATAETSVGFKVIN